MQLLRFVMGDSEIKLDPRNGPWIEVTGMLFLKTDCLAETMKANDGD